MGAKGSHVGSVIIATSTELLDDTLILFDEHSDISIMDCPISNDPGSEYSLVSMSMWFSIYGVLATLMIPA